MLRAATEADLDRLIEIHAACYPDERGATARRLNFVQNPMGALSDLRVLELDGRIAGHGFGFSIVAHFGGAPVRALGIASVAVAPEARGTGAGSAIVAGLEDEARARGATVALLHAYRHGFYARRGYAEVTPNRRLACDPRAVPAAWVERARRAGIRAASRVDEPRIRELYARAATRATGWLERSDARWTRRFASERLHFFLFDGGYAALEPTQREAHAATRLVVHDLVADDDEARRVLWGFLGMQAGQIAELEVEVAEGDPILFALADVDGARFGDERVEHDLGRVVAGPMVRVLDARGALAARGYSRDGEARLVVDGAPLRLEARAGRGAVHDATGGDAAVLDSRALASIAFGGLRAEDAARLGLASGDAGALARAGDLLAIPPFFTLDRF